MNARDLISEYGAYRTPSRSKEWADFVIRVLETHGFTIMSKKDVERIERAILDDREGKVSAATVLHMIKDAMQR